MSAPGPAVLLLASVLAAPGPPAASAVLLAPSDPAPAADRDGTSLRGELDPLRARLETAVGRARRAALPATGGRVYRLPGYGAVLVLAPRALPRSRRAEPQTARAMADAARSLEEGLRHVRAPELRRQIEETLAALRRAQGTATLALPPAAGDGSLEAGGEAPTTLTIIGDRALEGDFERMHEEAEAFRREAALARARAEREIRVTLGMEPVAPPPPPGPRPAVPAPAPPAPVLGPLPPPASFRLLELEPDDGADPTQMMARVRAAITEALVQHRGALNALPADEFLVIAVDFVPRVGDRQPARTLQARVRRRDLDLRHAGALDAAGLAARITFAEY